MLSFNVPIILASGSPRRKQLLEDIGIVFTVKTKDTQEDFLPTLPAHEIPVILAIRKAEAFLGEITDEIIITADTIVAINNQILNKPADFAEAKIMLKMLSGVPHDVITGVCIMSKTKKITFADTTKVFLKELTDEEIHFYIENYKPYDKAGSYGAQEWLGMIGMERIEGSYFNVMGLPVHLVYENLKKFL